MPPPASSRVAARTALLAILRSADHLRRGVAEVVEPSGITIQQFNVLRILRGAGPDGLPTLEIGVRMIEQTPGVTRLIDRLEAKALVRRVRCPLDRRQVLCGITKPGRELLAALDARVAAVETRLMAALDVAELVNLSVNLSRLVPPGLPGPTSDDQFQGRRAAASRKTGDTP